MNSIPISAMKLGIDFEDYEKLGRNIQRIKAISLIARQSILEKADETFPLELREIILPKVRQLRRDMEYDRGIYTLTGIKYKDGPPEGEKLFITAIADYLLRHPQIINQNP